MDNNTNERLIIEKQLLGTLLSNATLLQTAINHIKPNIFDTPICKELAQAILDMLQSDYYSLADINPQHLYQQAQSNNVHTTLTEEEIFNIKLLNVGYDEFENIKLKLNTLNIRDKNINIINLYYDSICNPDTTITATQELITQMGNSISNSQKFDNNFITLKEATEELKQLVLENQTLNDDQVSGIDTGLTELNKFTHGWQKGDLITIAGKPSQGKSALALNFAYAGVKAGKIGAYICFEMKTTELTARLVSMQSDNPVLTTKAVLNTKLSEEQMADFFLANNFIADKKLIFDKKPIPSLPNTTAKILTLKAKYDIDFVVVDFIQMMQETNEDNVQTKEQFVGKVARTMKQLATELDIVVFILAQLNRGQLECKEPNNSLLRDSGQIEEASNIIMFVHRPEQYGPTCQYEGKFEHEPIQNTALIKISKGRNIGTTSFLVGFDGSHTKFYDRNIPISQQQNKDTLDIDDTENEFNYLDNDTKNLNLNNDDDGLAF